MNERGKNSPLSHLLEYRDESEESRLAREQTREQTKEKAILGEFDEPLEGFHFHHCQHCGADYECAPVDEKCFTPEVYPCHICRHDSVRRLNV